MSRVICHMSMSLDGFVAGPDQSSENPLGVRGLELHQWHLGSTDPADIAVRDELLEPSGAYVMGRNMYGPIRGEWTGDWRGWWGDEPPYHHDVFVLTHHPREPVVMEGGTTFFFVTDGIHAALDRAFDAAGGRDVRLGGGVGTIQQYLRAGLIDELHLAIVPVLLGRGERLFDNLEGGPVGYECVELVSSPAAVHVRLERSGTPSS